MAKKINVDRYKKAIQDHPKRKVQHLEKLADKMLKRDEQNQKLKGKGGNGKWLKDF